VKKAAGKEKTEISFSSFFFNYYFKISLNNRFIGRD